MAAETIDPSWPTLTERLAAFRQEAQDRARRVADVAAGVVQPLQEVGQFLPGWSNPEEKLKEKLADKMDETVGRALAGKGLSWNGSDDRSPADRDFDTAVGSYWRVLAAVRGGRAKVRQAVQDFNQRLQDMLLRNFDRATEVPE